MSVKEFAEEGCNPSVTGAKAQGLVPVDYQADTNGVSLPVTEGLPPKRGCACASKFCAAIARIVLREPLVKVEVSQR